MRHTSAYADPPRASPNTSRLVVPRPFYMPPLLDPLCADSRLHCSVLAFHSFAASATPTTRVRHKRVTSQSQMTRAKTATDGDPYIRSHDHMIRRAYDHSGSGSRRLTPTVDHGRPCSTMVDHGRPRSIMVDHGRPLSTVGVRRRLLDPE